MWSSFLDNGKSSLHTCQKESACQCRRHTRCWFNPWVKKIPWRRRWQTALVFLAVRFHGQRHQRHLQSMGSQRVGCDWACIHTHIFIQRLINFCEIKCLVYYSAFLESKKHISFLVPPLPRLWLWGTFINSEFQGFFLVFPFHSVLRQLQCSGYPKSPPSLHSRVPPDFPSSTAICCPLLAPGGSTFLLLQWGEGGVLINPLMAVWTLQIQILC